MCKDIPGSRSAGPHSWGVGNGHDGILTANRIIAARAKSCQPLAVAYHINVGLPKEAQHVVALTTAATTSRGILIPMGSSWRNPSIWVAVTTAPET
jgi:hypothetical protein